MARTQYSRIVTAVILAAFCGSGMSFLCPPHYVALETRCLLFVREKLSWDEAKENCELKGGSLAQSLDHDTHALVALLDHLKADPVLNHTGLWLGGTDVDVEDEFRWLNGDHISMSSLFWGNFEPNGGPLANCLELWFAADRKEHIFADSGCGEEHASICSPAAMT